MWRKGVTCERRRMSLFLEGNNSEKLSMAIMTEGCIYVSAGVEGEGAGLRPVQDVRRLPGRARPLLRVVLPRKQVSIPFHAALVACVTVRHRFRSGNVIHDAVISWLRVSHPFSGHCFFQEFYFPFFFVIRGHWLCRTTTAKTPSPSPGSACAVLVR